MAGPSRSSPRDHPRAAPSPRLRPLRRRLPPVALRPILPPPPPHPVASSGCPPPMAHHRSSTLSRGPLFLQPFREQILPKNSRSHLRTLSPYLPELAVGFSPPPNYILSTIDSTSIYLFRWFDSSWVQLKVVRSGGLKSEKIALSIDRKHYCILLDDYVPFQESFSIDLLVLDPLSSPPAYSYGVSYLVESDGEPLLVNEILKCEKNSGGEYIVWYEVFRADLSRKMWVRAESIGDSRVLMFYGTCSVSLLAADIGATGNCICFPTKSKPVQDRETWKMFDLRTGRVTGFMLPNALQFANYDYRLFMPSLC